MLNNHEVNLTDEEAAAEVARVAKTYPVVRLLSADQIRLIGQNVCPRWGHRRRSMPLFQPFKFRARF